MSFLRNCWCVAGYQAEVGRDPIARIFPDEPVLMYRKESGDLVAMDDRCAHRLAPLSKGRLIGDTIQCRYHGLQYDATGARVKLPAGGCGSGWATRHSPEKDLVPDYTYLEDAAYGWFDGEASSTSSRVRTFLSPKASSVTSAARI